MDRFEIIGLSDDLVKIRAEMEARNEIARQGLKEKKYPTAEMLVEEVLRGCP